MPASTPAAPADALRRMAPTSRLLCGFAFLLALAACDRRDPTAPLAPAGASRALDFDTAQLTLAGYEMVKVFNVPVKIDDASVPWTSTGITLAAGELAYVIPEGSVSFSLNDLGWRNCAKDPYWYCTKVSGSAGPYGGVGGPSGGHDGHLRLFYRVNGAGTPSQILALAAVAQGPGTIEVSRAGSDAYWDFSGAQTVQIWRVRGAQPPPPPQQEPKIALTCSPNPVVRGKEITCTASRDTASAPGELQISGWSFEGKERNDGDVTSAEWKGTMVEGGKITVQATVGGRRASPATVVVAVTDRSWTDVLQDPRIAYDTCARRSQTCLEVPPAEQGDLGKTYLPPFTYNLQPSGIGTGPNTGWWYFSNENGPVQLPQPVTLLNPEVFDPASDFYKRRNCRPVNVQRWVTEHEQAHIDIGRTQLRTDPINPWLERQRIYRPGAAPTRWYNAAVRRVESSMNSLMDPKHQLRSRYPTNPCDLQLAENS